MEYFVEFIREPYNQAWLALTAMLFLGLFLMWFFWLRPEIEYYKREDEKYKKLLGEEGE